jgi:protocatechuate 3,4-dioxygenase beta subunit
MHVRVLAAACVVGLFGASTQVPRDRSAPAATATGTGTIAGRLTVLGERSTPVRRARVTLSSDVLAKPQVATTDTDGRYRFQRLPAGTYHLTADKPGYVTLEHGARHALDTGVPIDLAAGQSRAGDFALPRGAAIEGRVTNDVGEPVQNLVVSAARLIYDKYGRRLSSVGQARTDDLGRYRIHSLPAGEYLVEAAPDSMQALTTAEAPGPLPLGLARTYYPGTSDAGAAQHVAAASGRDVTGIDFAMTSVALARVSGTIIDASGRPATKWSVRLQRMGAPPGEVRGIMMPESNQFLFPSVPPGRYWLLATVAAASASEIEFGALPTTVAGRDLTGVTVTTARGAALTGRVQIDGTAGSPNPLAALQVGAVVTEIEPPSPTPGTPLAPWRAAIDPDGSFKLLSVFGPCLLRPIGLPEGWALARVTCGDDDITDVATDVQALERGLAERPLTMVITNRTGSVSGKVTTADNQPGDRVRVVLFPEDERTWGGKARVIAAAITRADGSFAFQGLLPGKYLACAVEHLDEGAWLDPDVLHRLRAVASSVTILEGGRHTVALKVQVP